MTERIRRVDDGPVVSLVLNRPDKLNALDTTAFEELERHVGALEADDGQVACVVIRGAGRSFCAGADLETARAVDPSVPVYKSRVLARLAALPMPVIAAVHGHCVGGGLELALCADLIVAAESARIADAHGRWGFVPAWGLTQRLPRRVGAPAAKLMIFTGRPIDGIEAHRIGLADVVASDAGLDAEIARLTSDIAGRSGFTHREVKRLIRETEGLPIDRGLAHEHFRHPRLAPSDVPADVPAARSDS